MRTLPVSSGLANFKNSVSESPDTTKPVSALPIKEGGKYQGGKLGGKEGKLEGKNGRTGQIVTSALALAALVVSIGAVKKGQRSNDALFKDIETEVSALMTEIKNKASNEELVEKYNRLYGMLTEWERINPHEVGKNIDELKNVINELGNKISQKAGFPTRMVEVNGRQIPMLATVFNPIEGKSKEVMEKTLRSEAAKRIFGVGTGLKEVPEKATVRIPTSEIRPYSSTGGMSIVPKEIADNLAKLVAGKQDVSQYQKYGY